VGQLEGPPHQGLLIDALPALSLCDGKLSSRPCAHAYLILLCSQKTRDAEDVIRLAITEMYSQVAVHICYGKSNHIFCFRVIEIDISEGGMIDGRV
jgi:hypothetical protein